jgi:hypothetical protein
MTTRAAIRFPVMLPLGDLPGDPPEPMTRNLYVAVQQRIRRSWDGTVTIAKRDAETLLAEIAWLRRRLQRVEHVVEPIAEDIRRNQR